METETLALVLSTVGTVLTSLVVFLLRKKLNLQITQEQEKLIADILHRAVHFAEEWGTKQTKLAPKAPPTGVQKLDQAVTFTRKELTRAGISMTESQINDLLHSTLGTLRK